MVVATGTFSNFQKIYKHPGMSDDDLSFRLDKTAFRAMTFEEADDHYSYWKGKSLKERWDTGCYLSMQMYGSNKHTPIDKTAFTKRKQENR